MTGHKGFITFEEFKAVVTHPGVCVSQTTAPGTVPTNATATTCTPFPSEDTCKAISECRWDRLPRPEPTPEMMFGAMDADGDKKVTLQEMLEFVKVMSDNETTLNHTLMEWETKFKEAD